jgi:hypothetical protein
MVSSDLFGNLEGQYTKALEGVTDDSASSEGDKQTQQAYK